MTMLISREKENHNGDLTKEYGKDQKDPGIYNILTLWS